MQSEGRIEEQMMYNTYNMGLGMVLAVSPEDADGVINAVKKAGEEAYAIGEVISGNTGVEFC